MSIIPWFVFLFMTPKDRQHVYDLLDKEHKLQKESYAVMSKLCEGATFR